MRELEEIADELAASLSIEAWDGPLPMMMVCKWQDWFGHIPQCVVEKWPILSRQAKAVAFITAQSTAAWTDPNGEAPA